MTERQKIKEELRNKVRRELIREIRKNGRLDYGEALRKWRKNTGLSQEEFASIIGVEKITVGRWERGECSPSASMQGVIAEAQKLMEEKNDD